LLVLGSVTSPEFRETAPGLQRLADHFVSRVHVVLLYTREAHPADGPGPYPEGGKPSSPAGEFARSQHVEPPDRAAAAKHAWEKLGLGAPLKVLVDGMDNEAWGAYGPAPNNAFLIDRHGYVVARQAWFEMKAMESAIQDLLARDKPPAPARGETAEGVEEGGGR
jgi:hypothetical protein